MPQLYKGRSFDSSKVLAVVHQALGIKECHKTGSVRSVLYACHVDIAKRDPDHAYSYKSIDREREHLRATGTLPECVYRYYVEVVEPAKTQSRPRA